MSASSSRLKQISDLDLFITEKKDVIDNVLEQLGWDEKNLSKTKCCCPVNPGHWLPESSLSHHQDICKYMREGYLKEDLKKDLPDSRIFYEKSPNVVHVLIDSAMQESVLSDSGLLRPDQNEPLHFPQTVERWSVQLSPEQRLAVYDHIIEIAKATARQKNIDIGDLMLDFEKKDESDKPKSKLELLAEMRDYKRRRQSYRAKNVHITKKSYTEILKEVIENQMSFLAETSKLEVMEDGDNTLLDIQNNTSDTSFSSLKHHEKHSDHITSSRKRHHSKEDGHDGYSYQRKKHKKHRSRSRTPSRHKHKSHKHKKSYD